MFVLKDTCAVYAYACDGVTVKDNTFAGNDIQEKVVFKDTVNFEID